MVSLLKTFLSRAGDKSGATSVAELESQLDGLNTTEEIDEFQAMLRNLTDLSLDKFSLASN